MDQFRQPAAQGRRPSAAGIPAPRVLADGAVIAMDSPMMLYSVGRVALAQGMLMARFGMTEGQAMTYLSDQAKSHEITLVGLAERIIERAAGA